jgi:GNAT superfamily N-acetyltransferase
LPRFTNRPWQDDAVARVEVHPVTAERWPDLEALFGPSGAYSSCWCMWFRLTSSEFQRQSGAGTRRGLRSLVSRGREPGLVAYVDGRPAGWVSVAPREEFGRIERSPILKRVDEAPVWSIVCFFIGKGYRSSGLLRPLLNAAERYAGDHGARTLEAYPWDPAAGPIRAADAYIGLLPIFEEAGFREVARRSRGRPVVRKKIRARRARQSGKGPRGPGSYSASSKRPS